MESSITFGQTFKMETGITIDKFNEIKKIPMVFVLGKERSGTTLLQTFLEGHPNIVAPPESEFVVLLYPKFGKIKKWTEKDISNFIEELYKEPWLAKIWHIDRKQLTSILLSVKDGADYASICRVIYYCMRGEKENIILISDKNPIYILLINTLLTIFPEARFINLIREPRDNVSSHLNSFKVNNVRFVSMKWLAYNRILSKAQLRIPGKFHTVLYENLVSQPEVEMKKICSFLNIGFDANMVHNAFPERLKNFDSQKLIFDRALDIHANLLKPVNTSNIGKWKTGLSAERVLLVEAITAEFASKEYHYEISKPVSISVGTRLRIFKSRIIYYSWQVFTRMKYKSYLFNRFYTRLNIFIGRETRAFGKVLRES